MPEEKKLKIILPDLKTVTNGDLDMSLLEKYGEVVTYSLSKTEDLPERLKDADVILCNKTLLNPQTLVNAKNLKYIGLFATGYNNVDLDFTKANGITVCNAGSYSTESVAQHTFALMLNYFNKITKYNEFVQDGGWKRSKTFSPFVYQMSEINSKTLGIIGFGSIGKRVAEIALAFGMNVLVYSRNIEKTHQSVADLFDGCERISAVTLDELASKSDVITIHCPLNKQSEKMVNKELLSKFKKTSYLINTSRGGVIDEDALYVALETGIIAGAALDVMETEPMPEDCKLFEAKNITITPHVAWAPLETRQRLFKIVVDNLESFLSGNPKNVITK